MGCCGVDNELKGFTWKQTRYDSENRRHASYLCSYCSQLIEGPSADLHRLMSEHRMTCAAS